MRRSRVIVFFTLRQTEENPLLYLVHTFCSTGRSGGTEYLDHTGGEPWSPPERQHEHAVNVTQLPHFLTVPQRPQAESPRHSLNGWHWNSKQQLLLFFSFALNAGILMRSDLQSMVQTRTRPHTESESKFKTYVKDLSFEIRCTFDEKFKTV